MCLVRAIADYSNNNRAAFVKAVTEAQDEQQYSGLNNKRKRLVTAQKRTGELETLLRKIYEDYALGKLPEARYAALDGQYAKEQDALSKEIAEIEAAINGYERSRKSADKFIALVEKSTPSGKDERRADKRRRYARSPKRTDGKAARSRGGLSSMFFLQNNDDKESRAAKKYCAEQTTFQSKIATCQQVSTR